MSLSRASAIGSTSAFDWAELIAPLRKKTVPSTGSRTGISSAASLCFSS